ncbi:glycoside hydrolase family 16 protein [Spirillospora sp. NPDC048911]|uniref:glycoside hydrolase family 16 protein n=1 Tax=Spirillospora sp. NPDC048911 TaxID=3364527 RepID=UPI00371BE243
MRSEPDAARPRPSETPPPSPRPVRKAGPKTPGFWGKPVLVDGFDGDRVDTSKWLVYDYPNARTNPRTKAATKVEDGTLKLTGGIYKGKDLSGGIASHLNLTHGRWEVRMRAEKGVGYSAVALLWPEVFGRPEYAEIDFAEVIDATRQNVGIFIHHGPGNTMRPHNIRTDATEWHTYAVDWLPHSLTFWMDGKKVWSYRGPLTPERSKMGLALQNDQVCDRGRGFCRTRGTPKWVTMHVDWVKIYKHPK